MLEIKVNAERAGRVQKPANTIEIFNPVTGEKIASIGLSLARSWVNGGEARPEIHLSVNDSDTRTTVRIDNDSVPEIIGSWRGSGAWMRWDPHNKDQEETVRQTVEKLVRRPVEIIQVERRLSIEEE